MSTFQVPFSSSPIQPSTPDADSRRTGGANGFASTLASHPSTTPLGPPPSSVGSFTPDGPPPRTLLGSSQIRDDSTFGSSDGPFGATNWLDHKSATKSSNHASSTGRRSWSSKKSPNGNRFFGGSARSSQNRSLLFAKDRDREFSEAEDELLEDDFGFPSLYGTSLPTARSGGKAKSLASSSRPMFSASKGFDNSTTMPPPSSPRGAKRSRAGELILDGPQKSVKRWNYRGSSLVSSIAKGLTNDLIPAPLIEPGYFIADLERGLSKIGDTDTGKGHDRQDRPSGIGDASRSVCQTLESLVPEQSKLGDQAESFQIGPGQDAIELQYAAWLSLLILKLHDTLPGTVQPPGQQLFPTTFTSVPRSLLNWLNRCHNPWVNIASQVNAARPNPTAHASYWDIVSILILRGKLDSAIFLLEKSDFRFAECAVDDGYHNGYPAPQAEVIKSKIGRLIELLKICPGFRGDWHTNSNAWALFKKDARKALAELDQIAAKDRSTVRNSNKVEHPVPLNVYQSLKSIYGILLGGETELMASAQDWVEATIGLTVWKNQDESTELQESTMGHRAGTHVPSISRLLSKSHEDDLFRLFWSFRRAIDDSKADSFQIDTSRAAEIGLACVFEGDYERVFKIVLGWSIPVSDAVLELATAEGWYTPEPKITDHFMQNFDEEDLMVLSSHEQQAEPSFDRDTIMAEYAGALFRRGEQSSGPEGDYSDWQLAMSVLTRIGNRAACGEQIDEIVSDIVIDSDATLDAIIDVCQRCNLDQKSYDLAEKHADMILETSEDYGRALKYYARAHAASKLRNLLDLLISMSLIRSEAYPATDSLDEDLQNLLNNTNPIYERLFSQDQESALLLYGALSGYATTRAFYNYDASSRNSQAAYAPRQQKLLALIASAVDNIEGGILDEQRTALIRFEGLLVLLGEALFHFKDSEEGFDLDECAALLDAAENLRALPESQYQRCEDFFHSSLAYYQQRRATLSPSKLMQTMSNMTSGSSFSLVSSSLLESMSGNDSTDSAVLVAANVSRQHSLDWRAGWKKETKGESVLQVLRLQIAQRLSKSWIKGAPNR